MCNRFHISHFHVCWSVVTRGCVFPAVLSNSCQKTTMADFRYKSLKSWKIDPPALSSPGLLRGRLKDNDRARSADRAGRFNAPFHCFRTSRTFLWSLKWNGRLFFVVMTTCSTSMTCFSFYWKSCPVQNNGRCIKMSWGDRLHTRCQNYESAY